MIEVDLKSVPEMQVAYICHEGSNEELVDLIKVLFQWLRRSGLHITGPPFGVYYKRESIDEGDSSSKQLEYEVGIPFQGDAREEKGIRIRNIPERIVLSSTLKCPYGEIKNYYDLFIAYAIDHGFEVIDSPIEIYLNQPTEVPEVDLLTEIQLPVYQKSTN